METIDEPIKNLLQSTGWSLGDLLGKLQKLQTSGEGEVPSQEDFKNCSSVIECNQNNNNKNENKEKNSSTGKIGKIIEKKTLKNGVGPDKKIIKDNFAIQKKILAKKLKYNHDYRISRLRTAKVLKKYRKYYKKIKKKPSKNVVVLKPVEKPRKDIRDKIKEQLELLRNKKQPPLSLPKPAISNVSQITKKRPSLKISELLLEKFCDNSNDSTGEINYNVTNSSSSTKKHSMNRSSRKNSITGNSDDSKLIANELFESTSNDFIITNVMGGYRSPEEEFPNVTSPDVENKNNTEEDLKVRPFINIDSNNDSDKSEEEEEVVTLVNGGQEEPIWPTKTNDITKIKGWQKKKFVLPETTSESESNNYEVVYTTSPIASTSFNRKTYVESKTGAETNDNTESGNKNSKSVFISDSLDQYLNENAKLNISYEVPKLIAEGTVTHQPTLAMRLPLGYSKVERTETTTKTKSSTYKPKTLAEKRKIMSGEFLPKLREKRKQSEDLEMKLLDVHKVIKHSSQPVKVIYNECPVILTTTDPFTKFQFKRAKNKKDFYRTFLYNRRRLRVVSTSEEKVVGRIFDNFMVSPPKQYVSPEEKNRQPQNTKPSLLRCLEENKVDTVSYKPGPLSHKIKLQKNLQSQWKTFIVKLPKIFVEIEPCFRKPVHPRVREIIKKDDDVILDKDRVDFALSALKQTEHSQPRTIKFPLSYANDQKSLMLRRKIPIEQDDKETFISVIPLSDEQQTTEEIVKNVVDRMLDYVDTKEIEQSILKEDPDLEGTSEREGLTPPSPIGTNVSTIIKKQSHARKKSRTALELKRLNVKIIEVDVEDPENDIKCEKEYCKMGCVCSSLQCNSSTLIQEHCGNEKCMLSCSCRSKRNNSENKLTLPVGTNILSAHVVNHLQDVAKKDLAKVEREFTQTVIKANNQTIVVGTDPKERLRRVTKVPKRYNDFFNKEVMAAIFERIDDDIKIKPEFIPKDAIINLKRYKFDIIPFCLVHEKYNCECSCKSLFSDAPQLTLKSPKNEFKEENSDGESIDVCKSNYQNEDLMKNSCSRTKGLATDYYLERNKTLSHLRKLQRSTRKLYVARNKHYFEKGEATKSEEKTSTLRKNKRKQVFKELRDFDELDKKLKLNESTDTTNTKVNNKNKVPVLINRKETTKNDPSQQNLSVAPKPIEHDLLQDLRTNKADLGKNLCLMSWKTLRVKFTNNTLFVWQSYSNYDPEILITSRPIAPSIGFMNIKVLTKISKQFVNTNHIVRWLTTGLPFEKMEDNLLVILSMGEKSCKICGVCEKLENSNKYRLIETNAKEMFNISPEPPASLQIDLTADDKTIANDSVSPSATPGTATIEKRKVIQENRKRVLFFSRHKYEKLNLISEKQIHLNKDQQNPVKAHLPFIEGGCRWRLIELENTFTYLYFVRSNYSIRYVDLLKAPSMVTDNDVTINLKSTEMRKNYVHPRFGIFCMPKSSKEVFVGPYGYKEEHDLEILTYMNKVLVNTDLYNQVKGNAGLKNGVWYYQADDPYGSKDDDNDDVQIIQEQPTCIDLTEDDGFDDAVDDVKNNVEDNNKTKEVSKKEDENNKKKIEEQRDKRKEELKVYSFLETIKKAKDKKDSDNAKITEFLDDWEKHPSNRTLIVSNVKDLGCIKVLRCPASQTFRVFCPFSNTIRTYSKLSGAVQLFEKELNEVLTPVPANFVLKCTTSDPKKDDVITQIDRNVLQGDHIVGEFGVKHIKEAPLLYIDQFTAQEEEAGSSSIKETKESFEKYKKFAYELLEIPTIRKCKDSVSIIRLAIREILELQLMEKRYKNERVIHELKKAELMSKYTRLAKKKADSEPQDPLASPPSPVKTTKELPPKENPPTSTVTNNDDIVRPFINLTSSGDELEKDTSPEKTNNIVGKKLKLITRRNSVAGPSAVFKKFSSGSDKGSSEGVVLPVKAYLKSPPWAKEICLMPPRSKRLREKLQKLADEENKANKTSAPNDPKKVSKSLRAWRKGSGKNPVVKQANNVVFSVKPTLTPLSSIAGINKLQYTTAPVVTSTVSSATPTIATVDSGSDPSKYRFIKLAPKTADVKVPIQFVKSADSKMIPVKLHFPGTSILKNSLQPSPKANQNALKN